jgi:hypothetical protein
MANPNIDARPRLVRSDAPGVAGDDTAERQVPSLVWVLVALIAFSLGAAVLQTERLDRMSDRADALAKRADALQIELAGARTQIRTFEMQRELVRESVADLAQRVSMLHELVRVDALPARPAEPSEPAH